MKAHRDGIAAVFGLVLGVTAMAGTVLTDEYAHAAGAEARGYDALFHVVATGEQCDATAIPSVLVATNEVKSEVNR
jgi:hypothetical protein